MKEIKAIDGIMLTSAGECCQNFGHFCEAKAKWFCSPFTNKETVDFQLIAHKIGIVGWKLSPLM